MKPLLSPQGPGFLIFFQTKKESWGAEAPSNKRRDEEDILLLLQAAYEAGTFN